MQWFHFCLLPLHWKSTSFNTYVAYIYVKFSAMKGAASFKSLGPISSVPVDFLTSSLFKDFKHILNLTEACQMQHCQESFHHNNPAVFHDLLGHWVLLYFQLC